MNINKILIANRGEIALRIIRACRELGIQTVAVHSEGDEYSLHRNFADEDICIGPASSSDSYLNIPNIISAARITGTDAIHPGYGFLAESAKFSDICKSHEIKFIGPTSNTINRMGDKATARQTMQNAGVPVVPGSQGCISDENEALDFARKIGFPVIVKATAGGGGKGMRIVHREDDFLASYRMARAESGKAFSSDEVYIEKYIMDPHHVEVQILADEHGNVIHLGERDCSIQRSLQKLIEESPSPIVDDNLARQMGEAATKGAAASDYHGAGTIEFLVDNDHNFYFMEMNTRIQVEHPVSEMVTQIDLIKEQIRIASGAPINYRQEDVAFRGHAIECRINAEDPYNSFAPCPGQIHAFHTPGGFGVRVDTHVYSEYCIPPYYDSLLAKLIVWAKDREEAISRMKRALNEFIIEGVNTTIPFHKQVLNDERFVSGDFNTRFLENFNMSS